MQKRTIAVLVVLGLVASAGLAALVLRSGPPIVELEQSKDAADKVTLYQNGVAFVELERSFDAPPGDALLEFPVPTSAVVDSVRVEGQGVSVREVRASQNADPVLQPGDQLLVHVEERTYEGTLVGHEGASLVLDTETGTTVVQSDKVEAIELQDRTVQPDEPGAAKVQVRVNTEGGNRTVRVSYLAHGAGWTPHYTLDVDTGAFTFFATVQGIHDWRNVTLDLVSGAPHMVATPRQPTFEERAVSDTAGGAGASAPSFEVDLGPSQRLGDLHRYSLERPTNLTRGETLRLPVRTGQVDLLRHYHSASASTGFGGGEGQRQDVQVLERYEIENTLKDPLPPGIVRVYTEGTWIAEDHLDATPVGATANLTTATSQEVQAFLTLESQQSTATKDTATYRLTVENKKTGDQEPVDLRAQLTWSSFRTNLVTSEPTPDRTTGSSAVWNDALPTGQSLTYRITIERIDR